MSPPAKVGCVTSDNIAPSQLPGRGHSPRRRLRVHAVATPTPDRPHMGSDPGAQGNSIQSNGQEGPGPKLRHGLIGSYSRPICAELEASPVSLPNWAGPFRDPCRTQTRSLQNLVSEKRGEKQPKMKTRPISTSRSFLPGPPPTGDST